VLDFQGFSKNADFMGNPFEALNFKALRLLCASFQQSYPQKFWIEPKAL
jgi:hypothetical protein